MLLDKVSKRGRAFVLLALVELFAIQSAPAWFVISASQKLFGRPYIFQGLFLLLLFDTSINTSVKVIAVDLWVMARVV